MEPRKFEQLYAQGLKPTQGTVSALKKRMLRSPHSTHGKLLAWKVLNNHSDLVPACCVVHNLMAANGEFDSVNAMLDQLSGDEYGSTDEDATENSAERTGRNTDQGREIDSGPEKRSDDEAHPSQSPPRRKSSHNRQFSPEERKEFTYNMIRGILDDPEQCRKWFGISKPSFREVLRDLTAIGLPESAVMSAMERLALFLNLMTTGDPILQVARRFGPRVSTQSATLASRWCIP